jgi:lipoate-protein ligase A
MLFVDNQNITDPRLNLALEEHLLRHVEEAEPILLFYINEPAVIIGRNQNTLEEIDPDYVEEEGIHLVRRLSGGGAVFHDLGNLNFSFVTDDNRDIHNFAKFTDPVIDVLRELGVDAELRDKSDIFADGKKISGNAQYSSRGRMFSHGTLLFDTDLEMMLKALNPRGAEIESKAVQSVRNYVTNIRELLDEEMTIEELKAALLAGIFDGEEIPTYELSDTDWREVEQLAEERYKTWEWNVGRSPKFDIRQSEQIEGVGKVDARINVDKGKIQAVKIYGDFSGAAPAAELEDALVGARYERGGLEAALEGVEIGRYINGLSTADFVNLLYG